MKRPVHPYHSGPPKRVLQARRMPLESAQPKAWSQSPGALPTESASWPGGGLRGSDALVIASAGNLGASLFALGEEANHAKNEKEDGGPGEHDRGQRHRARASTADPRSDTCQ